MESIKNSSVRSWPCINILMHLCENPNGRSTIVSIGTECSHEENKFLYLTFPHKRHSFRSFTFSPQTSRSRCRLPPPRTHPMTPPPPTPARRRQSRTTTPPTRRRRCVPPHRESLQHDTKLAKRSKTLASVTFPAENSGIVGL